VICVTGSGKALGDWQTDNPITGQRRGNWWVMRLNLGKEKFPVAYKYGVYNCESKHFVRFEAGDNRLAQNEASKGSLVIMHDGFVQLPASNWRGAGVAIPVFSLRSNKSFGTGEFTDIKLMVDWAVQTGLKLLQLLPVNDTTATHTEKDSYPYAAVSAFALHPLFLNIEKVAGKEHAAIAKGLAKKQKQLNDLPVLDYAQVMKFKTNAIKELYLLKKEELHNDQDYFSFFELNRHWLVPYAAFCYLRDKYKTAEYETL
jgi:4-alpha-glucanotransferase